MRHFSLSVFRRTSEESDLRFLGPEGKRIDNRPLPDGEVDDLIGALAGISCELEAGQALYDWLDGPKRWMSHLRQDGTGLVLAIDVEGRLRQLPWELLADGGAFLCTDPSWPFTPVCHIGRTGGTPAACNRPLRVLSMTCSPEDVEPVLDLENEERLILEATRSQPIELLVEESGSLEGLEESIASFPQGHFDVFHLAGHARNVDGRPVFAMEDELGRCREATAEDIARAFAGRWPRLLFLSGCGTGESVDRGAFPSLCEAMVLAGAPAVLGWTLPVPDATASEAASVLYQRLAVGDRIDEAVARTRLALSKKDRRIAVERHLADARQEIAGRWGVSDWHLLRLYADRTPLSGLVTPLRTPGRTPPRSLSAAQEFLDRGARSEVCPRGDFVGRRRLLQRSLAVLKSHPGEPLHTEGLLLYGLGGLGKSSAAARLCERLTHLSRLVWVGRIDEEDLLDELRERIEDAVELERLDDRRLPLKTRLRRLLEGPFATEPAVFVFDDFEQNLDIRADGSAVVQPEALAVLRSVLGAIRESASESRVLVTCRYLFEVPGPARLHVEALESMRGADLQKKLRRMAERKGVVVPLGFEGVVLAAGNPRLLERMQAAVNAPSHEEAGAPTLEPIAAAYREELGLASWVARQEREGRRLLALLSAFEWPVHRSVLEAVATGFVLDPHLDRAAAAGLAEKVEDPLHGLRYSVSSLLRPLLEPELADPGRAEEWRCAAQRLEESFRTCRSSGIKRLQDVDPLVAAYNLLARSRSRDAVPFLVDKVTPFLAVLGSYPKLIALYSTGLAAGIADPKSRAVALNNLGNFYVEECDFDRAIPALEQTVALARREGWGSCEIAATARRAACHAMTGDCARALELLQEMLPQTREHALHIEEISCLVSIGNCHAALGDAERAVACFTEALAKLDGRNPLLWGTALHSLAESLADRGELADAIAAAGVVAAVGEQVNNPKLLAEGQTALARIFLLAGQLPQAREAAKKSVQYNEPLYRPHAFFLLGLTQLLGRESSAAAGSFTTALEAAEALLATNPANVTALEVRALAAAGRSLCLGSTLTGTPEEALRAVRDVQTRSALAGRAKRFDALLGLLAKPGDELPGAPVPGGRPALELIT